MNARFPKNSRIVAGHKQAISGIRPVNSWRYQLPRRSINQVRAMTLFQ